MMQDGHGVVYVWADDHEKSGVSRVAYAVIIRELLWQMGRWTIEWDYHNIITCCREMRVTSLYDATTAGLVFL